MGRNIEKIAAFFREHRIKAGLTPEDVTKYLDRMTVDQVQEFESGQKRISTEAVFALVNLYGISPDEVLDFLYDVASTPTDESLEDCG